MVLKYPSDLSSRYYLALNFSNYQRPDPFTQAVTLTTGTQICLPMPAELRNRLDLNWDSTARLNPAVEAGLDFASGQNNAGANWQALYQLGLKGLPQVLGGVASGVADLIAPDFKTDVDAITNFMKSATSMTFDDALQRMGLALNPVLTVQFKNPRFKVYSFSWRFAPDNNVDDNNLDAIIQIIDRNAKPSLANGGAFFGYPSIATIQLVTQSTKELFKIQPCVVTAFEVNYAPHGIPSFLAGTGHATVIDIKLELLEIILNTRQNATPETPIAAMYDGTTSEANIEQQALQTAKIGLSNLAGIAGNIGLTTFSKIQSFL